MKTTILTGCLMLCLSMGTALASEEMKTLRLWASDFSDSQLAASASSGDSCAAWLKYLRSPQERYTLQSATGMQGPPGVVYTLISTAGEVAILKCGTTGSHDHADGGGHG